MPTCVAVTLIVIVVLEFTPYTLYFYHSIFFNSWVGW